MYVNAGTHRGQEREVIGTLGAGVTESWKSPSVSAGTELWPS